MYEVWLLFRSPCWSKFACRCVCYLAKLTGWVPHPAFIACRSIRCRPACVFFLTARWRISSRHSLHPPQTTSSFKITLGIVILCWYRSMYLKWLCSYVWKLGFMSRSRCRIRISLHAEEFVAGQRVCVFSDRMMAHQHLESVVVRKIHVGGMGNTFSCFPLPS